MAQIGSLIANQAELVKSPVGSNCQTKDSRFSLTSHVIQVSAGQHLGLGLIGRLLLVGSRLCGSHAADADPILQVVVAPQLVMMRLPPSEPSGRS